jgi:putative GTP pyrophosphokinase
VDRIGTLIESEFGTDPERSIDKRKVLDPDRFGYLSLHYICGLHPNRLNLPENRRYAGLWCEIQIRSILQHAWAEIEHDLGYKSDNTVPAPIRRRFSRLAGLLEIADQEFKSIRDELESYAARVEDEIKAKPSQVGIDDVSLAAFIRNDELCRELDVQMAKETGLRPDPESLAPQRLADYLRHAGLVTMSELRNELELNRDLIRCQLVRRISRHAPSTDNLNRGISLLQLAQIRIARGGLSSMLDFFTAFGFKDPDETIQESAQRIILAVEECSNERR